MLLHVLYIIVRVLYICVLLCYRDVESTKDPIDDVGYNPGRRERHAKSTPVVMCCHEVMKCLSRKAWTQDQIIAVLDVDTLIEMRDNIGGPADVGPSRLSDLATRHNESTPRHSGP